jgi:hypothetical protein
MSTSLQPSTSSVHPQPVTAGERDRLQEDIQRVLLQVPGAGDQKVVDRKKDIRKGFNRVAETLSQFLVHSYNNGRPIAPQLVNAIGDFFSARTQRGVRRLKDLFQIETKEEGDVNCVQMEIAQGDRSTPTIIRLITEIDELVPVLLEIRAAAVAEVHAKAERQC